ncbi:MAG: hypothetical protein HOV79_32785 [Hamadaea sp.]|nr:hypothetical protein [Hamadaea sp.]
MEYAELAFAEYARTQAMRARSLMEAHRRERTDCCRACGRSHPCDLRRYAGELLAYFDQWLPATPVDGSAPVDKSALVDGSTPVDKSALVDGSAPVDKSAGGDQDSIHGSA